MSDRKYWVWLSLVMGAGSRTDELFCAFKNPQEVYETEYAKRKLTGVFTPKQLERSGTTKLSDAENILSVCDKNGWGVLTPDMKEYPAGLRKLVDFPIVLYVDGDITCVRGKVMIGVVGTRKPCNESIAIARKICTGLASAGAVVVSGGALGIDRAAHESSMEAGGKTVCVLGCGLGTRYLLENEAMRRDISRSGAVISEFPPFYNANRTTFPIRNRIISGISHGVLVVEAGAKSGSLITAGCAAEQGREVFSIPGSVLTTAYTGANNLIRDGAKAVTCARDILESYAVMYPDRLDMSKADTVPDYESVKEKPSEPMPVKKEMPEDLDPNAKAVYGLFGTEPLHPDDIAAESGLPMPKVISALMMLEINGLIKQTNGKNYVLNN